MQMQARKLIQCIMMPLFSFLLATRGGSEQFLPLHQGPDWGFHLSWTKHKEMVSSVTIPKGEGDPSSTFSSLQTVFHSGT